MNKYKKLYRLLLAALFTTDEYEYELMEQIILRYGYEEKLLDFNKEGGFFVLTKKGEKFIEGCNLFSVDERYKSNADKIKDFKTDAEVKDE